MIRGVIFDAGGVLLTLGEHEYRSQLAKRMGLQTIPRDYELHVPQLQRGELPESEFWASIAGEEVAEDAFDDIWLAHFRPIPEMFDLVRDLRTAGAATAVLSNTQPSHVRLMRRMGFLDGFDCVVFSCDCGYRKPEEAIFAHTLRCMRLTADEVVFVDDMEENVAAAQRLGIRGILHTGDVSATGAVLFGLIGLG